MTCKPGNRKDLLPVDAKSAPTLAPFKIKLKTVTLFFLALSSYIFFFRVLFMKIWFKHFFPSSFVFKKFKSLIGCCFDTLQ